MFMIRKKPAKPGDPQPGTDTYFGSANWETGHVRYCPYHLFDISRTARDLAHAHKDSDRAVEVIRDYYQARNPMAGEQSVYADLVNMALCRVDWHEVVEALRNR